MGLLKVSVGPTVGTPRYAPLFPLVVRGH
jgi:hypothetical protein